MRTVKAALSRGLLRPLTWLGGPRLAHRLLLPDRLAIVTYHAVVHAPLPVADYCFLGEARFREHLDYLRRHFTLLPLREAVARLRRGERPDRPLAALTFDDGFQNTFTVAFPVLQALGVPATVFLNTAMVGTEGTLWFCRLHQALIDAGGAGGEMVLRWRGQEHRLRPLHHDDGRSRARASEALQGALKELPHEALVREVAALVRALGGDPDAGVPAGSPFRMLDHAAINTMAASGLIEFGAHTHSHAILARSRQPQRRQEVEQSVAAVAALSGRPCLSFAYPNGRRQDFGDEDVALLSRLGVEVAVTTEEGPSTPRTPPLLLRRYGVGCDTSAEELAWRVHHVHPAPLISSLFSGT